MDEILTFLILAPVAAFVCLGALVRTLVRHRRPLSLRGLLLCSFLVLLGHVLELVSTEPARILFFSRITYLFIALCPVFWFLFSLELTLGFQKFMLKPFILLIPLPLATTVIAWTNPMHGLLWRSHTFRKAGPFLVNVVKGYGPWFWVHFMYSYLLYLVGIVLIVREFFRQHRFYQKQAYWVLAGGILPLLSNLAYVFRIFGPLTKDYSPLMIALSGACFAIGIRKHGLTEFVPLPRDEVYMTLDYPVIVLDAEKRIIDWNKAASRIASTDATPGQRIEEIVPTLGPDFPTPDIIATGRTTASWYESGLKVEGETRVQVMPRSGGKACRYCVTLLAQESRSGPDQALSRREREILALVVAGLTNKEIADRLFISESTVKTHVHSLLKKAGAERREELRPVVTERILSETWKQSQDR